MDMEEENTEEEPCFPIGLGSALELFREKDEIFNLIRSLPEIFQNPTTLESSYENFRKILDRYQEQPHLLDRHLEEMIGVCLDIARSSSTPQLIPLKHLSLKFLRHLFKVRGPKEVVKRMPHEVADLAPVLIYLESENLDDPNTWESGYVYVMWLSILVINPFHLRLLDGEGNGNLTVAQRLMNVCKKCLVLNSNVGQASTILVSKFLTRPDMLEIYMKPFICWACDNLTSSTATFGTRMGSFNSLACIFKHAKRQEILSYGQQVLNSVLASKFWEGDTLVRKAGMKLIQRIGMMFMKTQIAPWRYQRGSRSLVVNLKASMDFDSKKPLISKDSQKHVDDMTQYEELTQFSGDIESILDKLLEGLKDKDTVVRWSAAKGIGRVTNRLPKEYGDEVVESLLSIFSDRESSGAWHGGCLALAELGRRGLLLPERLESIIPVVKKALIYDEIRGNFSVGSYVRDAACYVLWAFARAFEPVIVEPFAKDIATALIITILFDREVNCRRAASAAFQENVGRQGNFPHGIEIVTIADYFAIGVRSHAYTKVSVEIAQFSDYTRPMVDHLLALKFNHFDPSVREMTAQALANLTPSDPEYIRSVVMNILLPVTTVNDLATSHGAILSLSMVLVELQKLGKLELSPNNRVDIRNIALSILQRQFRASHRGQELLRQALSFYIKCCSLAGFPVHDDAQVLEAWHGLLEENISYGESTVRLKAAEALPHFFNEYYYKSSLNKDKLEATILVFCENLKASVLTTRLGYSMALGKMPLRLLQSAFPVVIEKLAKCATIGGDADSSWAECRREATLALSNIVAQGIVPEAGDNDWSTGIPIAKLDCELLFATFIKGMSDYTTDKRGDIGSWVREASMTGLKELTLRMRECESRGKLSLLTSETLKNILRVVAKQCVELIDNVRVHAGMVFAGILHFNSPPIDDLPFRKKLLEIFPEELCKSLNWRSSSETFPLFTLLLPIEDFTYSILSGFVVSGGCLSDTVLRDSNNAVTNYLQNATEADDTKELERIGNVLLQIFKDNFKVERVTIPWMKFLTQLLQSGLFTPILSEGNDGFGERLVESVKLELLRSNRIDKIAIGVELLCETMQGSVTIVRSALRRLVVFLCHSYPRVRYLTANKIFEALQTYGDTLECPDLNAGMAILSETSWDLELKEVKPKRAEFCKVMNIPEPQPIKK